MSSSLRGSLTNIMHLPQIEEEDNEIMSPRDDRKDEAMPNVTYHLKKSKSGGEISINPNFFFFSDQDGSKNLLVSEISLDPSITANMVENEPLNEDLNDKSDDGQNSSVKTQKKTSFIRKTKSDSYSSITGLDNILQMVNKEQSISQAKIEQQDMRKTQDNPFYQNSNIELSSERFYGSNKAIQDEKETSEVNEEDHNRRDYSPRIKSSRQELVFNQSPFNKKSEYKHLQFTQRAEKKREEKKLTSAKKHSHSPQNNFFNGFLKDLEAKKKVSKASKFTDSKNPFFPVKINSRGFFDVEYYSRPSNSLHYQAPKLNLTSKGNLKPFVEKSTVTD
jgi:hypothetical protein